MTGRLLLLYIVIPILDLYLLVRIGGVIGAGPVLALVILTALLGVTLARLEGFRVLRHWQMDLAQGRMPQEGVLSGVLVLLGAILLILPGVITDLVGLVFLFPPTRRLASRLMKRSVARKIRQGSMHVYTTRVHVGPPGGFGPSYPRSPFGRHPFEHQDGRTIEVEGTTIDETTDGSESGVDETRRDGEDRHDRRLGPGDPDER